MSKLLSEKLEGIIERVMVSGVSSVGLHEMREAKTMAIQLEDKNDKLLALFKEGGPLYILRAVPELPSGSVGDISLDNACSYLADYIAWFQKHREWMFDTIEKVHQVIHQVIGGDDD